mmetsp:Transcript_6768/g.12079  ORF Transcript_6768/g.12079 Transcript_6768/m.12079 type:complete len:241 (+) Transcript_6768:2934-3656(+)
MSLCSNCDKEIPQETYELHRIHCERNFTKCDCGATVQRSQLEAHRATEHAEVKCQNCEYSAPKFLYSHECLMGPVVCRFCEAHLPQSHYRDHLYHCGSRTEVCPKCMKYIPLRDYAYHTEEIDCLNPLAMNEEAADELLARQLQEEFYQERQAQPQPDDVSEPYSTQTEPSLTPIVSTFSEPEPSDEEIEPEPMSECPICGVSVSVSLLPRHTNTCLESSHFDREDQEMDEAILKSLQEH